MSQKALDPSIHSLALQNAPVAVLILNSSNTVIYANKTAQLLAGDKLKDANVPFSVLPTPFQQCILNNASVIDVKNAKSGLTCTLKCWSEQVESQQGPLSVHYYLDVSELQSVYHERDSLAAELARLTTRDTITGMPNRQAMLQGLEPLVSRSRRYENPLSVIRLRIAKPTALDQKYGAGAGDKTLVRVSQLLRDQMRWADLIGRYAEDEFLLILPETDGEAAASLVEKLAQRLKTLTINSDKGEAIDFDPHFGSAHWKKGDDAVLLLQGAASAMVSVKGAAA